MIEFNFSTLFDEVKFICKLERDYFDRFDGTHYYCYKIYMYVNDIYKRVFTRTVLSYSNLKKQLIEYIKNY